MKAKKKREWRVATPGAMDNEFYMSMIKPAMVRTRR
jgi:hypothetical protein